MCRKRTFQWKATYEGDMRDCTQLQNGKQPKPITIDVDIRLGSLPDAKLYTRSGRLRIRTNFQFPHGRAAQVSPK